MSEILEAVCPMPLLYFQTTRAHLSLTTTLVCGTQFLTYFPLDI